MTQIQKIQTSFWIIRHKVYVFFFILKACRALIVRGLKHDLSKFSKEEFEYVYILSTKGGGVKFGSKQYYSLVDSIMPAKLAHSSRNSHHPEYYDGKIERMTHLDIIEMQCDWAAASKRSGGSLSNSMIINSKKYNISSLMQQKLRKDMIEIGIWNS